MDPRLFDWRRKKLAHVYGVTVKTIGNIRKEQRHLYGM